MVKLGDTFEQLINEINNGGSGSGGNITVEVDELPTENIDASKIYMVTKNAEVYCKLEDAILTLGACVQDVVGVTPEINYKIVTELPTTGEVTDLQTFSVIYCYIYNNVPYVYGNAGTGNMWITVSALASQMGVPVEDKGRTQNIYVETEIGLYVYYDQIAYVWNNAWSKLVSNCYICEIDASNGEIGTYTEELFNKLIKNIDNAVIRLITNTGTFYIRDFFLSGDISALVSFINIGTELYTLVLSKDMWRLTGKNISGGESVDTSTLAKLNEDNVFQGYNEFYGETYFDGNVEMSNVDFSGNVDFSNANVTGLPTGGRRQVTLTELRSMLSNFGEHVGKIVTFSGKGVAITSTILRQVQMLLPAVIETNTITKNATYITASGNGGTITGNAYTLTISASSAKITYYQWQLKPSTSTSTANTFSVGSTTTVNLDDTSYNFYVYE